MSTDDLREITCPHREYRPLTDEVITEHLLKRRALPRIIPGKMNSKAKVVLKAVVGMSAGAAIGLTVSLLSRYVGSG